MSKDAKQQQQQPFVPWLNNIVDRIRNTLLPFADRRCIVPTTTTGSARMDRIRCFVALESQCEAEFINSLVIDYFWTGKGEYVTARQMNKPVPHRISWDVYSGYPVLIATLHDQYFTVPEVDEVSVYVYWWILDFWKGAKRSGRKVVLRKYVTKDERRFMYMYAHSYFSPCRKRHTNNIFDVCPLMLWTISNRTITFQNPRTDEERDTIQRFCPLM